MGRVFVHRQPVPVLYLHHYVEGGRRFSLQDRLLGAPVAGFLVSQRNRLHPADKVRQGGIHNQVVEGVAVGGGNELHAALGNGAGSRRFLFGAHFVDDDHLGHVVLNGLNHNGVLVGGCRHLHSPGASDGRMGYVAVACDLIGSVDDDDPFLGFDRQHTSHLPQHGGLADAGPTEQQDVLVGKGQVFDYLDGAEDRPAHAARYADYLPFAVPNGGKTVERAFNARPVIAAEIAQPGDHALQVRPSNLLVGQDSIAGREPGFRDAAKVQDHLQQVFQFIVGTQSFRHRGGQHIQ